MHMFEHSASPLIFVMEQRKQQRSVNTN